MHIPWMIPKKIIFAAPFRRDMTKYYERTHTIYIFDVFNHARSRGTGEIWWPQKSTLFLNTNTHKHNLSIFVFVCASLSISARARYHFLTYITKKYCCCWAASLRSQTAHTHAHIHKYCAPAIFMSQTEQFHFFLFKRMLITLALIYRSTCAAKFSQRFALAQHSVDNW